jgi:sugar/nucleoside kinase (ribokinase family)
MRKITVNGTGSAIADSLFTGVDFTSPEFRSYCSKVPGDGGLEPGKLVLTEDFEAFAGKPADQAISDIVGSRGPDRFNLGGPGPVALINTAQLTANRATDVKFYSTNGNDSAGSRLRRILEQTPVNLDHFRTVDSPAPITFALSDPNHNEGSGERTFVNGIRSAWKLLPVDLTDEFFDADIVLLGGTALVPEIHAGLSELTRRGKAAGGITVVTTVYDFQNEKKRPEMPWPLGATDDTYKNLDLLVTDKEEALRLSGTNDLESATHALISKGTSALVVTNGAKDVFCFSDGSRFLPTRGTLPVSHAVEDARTEGPVDGDTTGAGDNFAGGIIASIVTQLQDRQDGKINLTEACAWGIASGDFACFYVGGTFIEKQQGQKAAIVRGIVEDYFREHRDLIHGS